MGGMESQMICVLILLFLTCHKPTQMLGIRVWGKMKTKLQLAFGGINSEMLPIGTCENCKAILSYDSLNKYQFKRYLFVGKSNYRWYCKNDQCEWAAICKGG